MPAKKTTKSTLAAALPKIENKIDWRAIVSIDNILLNDRYLAEKGIDARTLTKEKEDELKGIDENVMISLNGFREIAERKGYKSIDYSLVDRTDDRSVVKCNIEWLPSEEYPEGTKNSAVANSQRTNTSPKFFDFADSIAENRAFIRTVKSSINLPTFILGSDEINTDEKIEVKQQSGADIQAMLRVLMESSQLKFEDLADIYTKGDYSWNSEWTGISSIHPSAVLTLTKLIKTHVKNLPATESSSELQVKSNAQTKGGDN